MAKPVFCEFGGMYQLRLNSAEEIRYIGSLEKARWSATSAPIEQFYCDPQLLTYLDTDHNGRIRVQELLAAQQWLYKNLASRSDFELGRDELQLSALDPKEADAQKMKQLAEHMLKELGLPSARSISLAQVRTFRSTYAGRFPNGDGVVPPEHATSAELGQLIRDIVAVTGGGPDLSGQPGVRAEDLPAFRERSQRFLGWAAEGAIAATEPPVFPTVLPWGADTAAASALVEELSEKIEQYFSQCDLLRVEPNAGARMQASPETLAGLDITNTELLRKWTLNAPLAPPREDGVLDLSGRLNPNYEGKLQALAATVLPRALNLADGQRPRLTLSDWRKVRELFAPYRDWQGRQPAPALSLSPERLQECLSPELTAQLAGLISKDSAVGEELQQFNNLEKLILLQRWFKELLNNFVSFPALFDRAQRALFAAGTMIIDGRELNFCVRVTDRAAHKKIAATSPMFVIYAELHRKTETGDATMEVAAALTSGSRGDILLGKRGVFYDRDGNEWDALVVDLIVNPISLWEAAIAPFVRLRDFVGDKIEKFAASKADAAESTARETATKKEDALKKAVDAPPGDAKPAAKPPEPENPANTTNLVIGLSLAFAALTSTLAVIIKAVMDTDAGKLVSGLAMVVFCIAALSAFLGYLKLRRRDLSTVLEACGWAMNLRMKLRRRMALLFTRRPRLPRGSRIAKFRSMAQSGNEPSLLGRLARLLLIVLMFGVGLSLAWKYEEIRQNGLLETLRTLPDALMALLR